MVLGQQLWMVRVDPVDPRRCVIGNGGIQAEIPAEELCL